MAVIGTMAMGCAKEEIPSNPKENTLKLEKTSLSLKYLQMEKIAVTEAGVDNSSVQWEVIEGNEIVSIINGNTIVGRKIGKAKILARMGEKKAIVEANVTSQDYIPVEEIIFNINGEIVSSKDDIKIWQNYELMNIKVVGYKPENASYANIASVTILEDRTPMVDHSFGDKYMGYMNDTHPSKIKGNPKEIKDSLLFRHGGVTYKDRWKDTIFLKTYLRIGLIGFPTELQENDVDKANREIRVTEKRLYLGERINYFDAGEEYYTGIGSGDGAYGTARRCINIRSGEKKKIPMQVFAPKDYNDILWGLGGDNNATELAGLFSHNYDDVNLGKLHVSLDGTVELDADFTCATYQINGREGRLIGFAAGFLIELNTDKCKELMEKGVAQRLDDREVIAIIWRP